MIQAIIFDFAGVLGTRLTPLFADLLHRDLGIEAEEAIHTWETYNQRLDRGTLPVTEFWKVFCDDLKIPSSYPVEEKFLTCVELNPEMVALASRLKKNGYATGILSNICPPAGEKIKRMRQLDGIIDVRILSYEVHEVKPEQAKEVYADEELRIYKVLEEELRQQAKKQGVPLPARSSILFIDDKESPCLAARQYGLTAIKYEYDMAALRHDLKKRGVIL